MPRLYAFGSNGHGQLGIGHVEDVNTPTPCIGIPEDQVIRKVSGGGNHSAVITIQGHVYMAGMSQKGEGLMKQFNQEWTIYQRRYSQHNWNDVSCGWASTLFVSDKGTVYGVGTSRWHELAGPSTEELVQIQGLEHIVSVSCGWRHAVALDQHGQVYGWGWGKHGQLGACSPENQIDKKKDIRSVHKLDMPQPVVQIACGHLHTLLLGKDGTMYAFGSNKYQQLEQVPTVAVASIDAGWHHSAALLSQEDRLVLWGRHDHGQLGKDSIIGHVKQVACGSEHTIVITKDDQVLAWGWNEHGNCTSEQENVLDPLVAFEQKACLIAAGCATSWIVAQCTQKN
ncbi:regulator of chromosome condensation 1/beta-lactamase-inhibitor protein II [Choanephora cucurbitarum]|nr:regulator of chromosome condensation 1/beta-lactamase-inhibitor protein II [Choanephora cucurbitarum]